MNWAGYSNLAMVTSFVIYLVAMGIHGAEWAVGGRVQRRSRSTVTDRELVASDGTVVGSDERSDGAAGDPDIPAEELDEAASEAALNRSERLGRSALTLTVIGFLVQVFAVVARGIAAQRAPWGNMYEFVTAASLFIVAGYLVAAIWYGQRWLGLLVTGLAALANGLAVTVFYVGVAPLVPALRSVWFIIHIIAAAVAGAAFNIGGLAAIIYLLRQRAERRGQTSGYLATLPSAKRLDRFVYGALAFAFPLWTFAVAAGAVWAQYAWGRPWNWDPKETWALVTWIIYACYLHARATAGWKGTRAAVIAIIGLVSFWFNFIGVNLLFSGLHSYAGI